MPCACSAASAWCLSIPRCTYLDRQTANCQKPQSTRSTRSAFSRGMYRTVLYCTVCTVLSHIQSVWKEYGTRETGHTKKLACPSPRRDIVPLPYSALSYIQATEYGARKARGPCLGWTYQCAGSMYQLGFNPTLGMTQCPSQEAWCDKDRRAKDARTQDACVARARSPPCAPRWHTHLLLTALEPNRTWHPCLRDSLHHHFISTHLAATL